jgi:hypothetical protein
VRNIQASSRVCDEEVSTMVFGKKKPKILTKKDIDELRAAANARLAEIQAQEDAISETPQYQVTQTPPKSAAPPVAPVQVAEPSGTPDLPPPFESVSVEEAVKQLFEEYGSVVGGGILPTDRDRVTVMLLFGIWTELKAIRRLAEEE